MSWLFGIKNKPPPVDQELFGLQGSTGGNPSGGGGGGGKDPPKKDDKGKGVDSYAAFSSAAFERAAQAAKEIEKSPYAGQVCSERLR